MNYAGPSTAGSSWLNTPIAMAFDAISDSIYTIDSTDFTLKQVFIPSGAVVTVAGNGVSAYSGDGSAASAAIFSSPVAVAVDPFGNVYVADSVDCIVRKVDVSSGNILTVAGVAGACGYHGDGQQATLAMLRSPSGVTIDQGGVIYIADTGNSVVRELVPGTGRIYTLVGNGTLSAPGARDASPFSSPFASSIQLSAPVGRAIDSNRNIFVADPALNIVFLVNLNEILPLVTPPTPSPTQLRIGFVDTFAGF